ncbi:Uncharacterised protein [Mycobacteroides abscessus subsp. abscessus]|nr:Uncharacterised protein [Mycobacteroides abscessus subsp. abscessus]
MCRCPHTSGKDNGGDRGLRLMVHAVGAVEQLPSVHVLSDPAE